MSTNKEEPTVPSEFFLPKIRESLRDALICQWKERKGDATFEFQNMICKLNKKKTRFILKYREEHCIVCFSSGYDVEHHLGFKVLACGHYNTCVQCCDDKLYRCPTCRHAFRCWWCQTNTGQENQPAPREDLFDQWGPLVWNAPSGLCGVCNQEIARELYVNRLMAYVNIDRIARMTGEAPEEIMEFLI